MCGRYTVIHHDQIVRVVFNVTVAANLRFSPRYNVAPTQMVPVITQGGEVQMMRWGLVPPWAKAQKAGRPLILARAETVAEKPSFRAALARRRCLILADGFYEWRKHDDGKTKTPMYIRMRDRGMFAFAGLWEMWQSEGGGEVPTCAVITTPANALMAAIHDRMPAILTPEDCVRWLAEGEGTAENLLACLRPYASEAMEAYAVGRRINSPRNEGPDLVNPVAEEATLF